MQDDGSTVMVESFFNTVAARMASHLREMLDASLDDFARFFEEYSSGNDFKTSHPHSEYHVMLYTRPPILIQHLHVDGSKISFDPPSQVIGGILQQCIRHIVNGTARIPRIESHLFGSESKLVVRNVHIDDEIVLNATKRVLAVLSKNLPGPQLYLHEYDIYQSLMDNKADEDISSFLRQHHTLEEFEVEIKAKNAQADDIMLVRVSAPLNLFNLDCRDLNEHLIKTVKRLRDKLVQYCIDDNTRLNKEIVKEYDEIASKVSVPADEVEVLVRTWQFLNEACDTTIYVLAFKIDEAKRRLMFLLDHAFMTRKLNIVQEIDQIQFLFLSFLFVTFQHRRCLLQTVNNNEITKHR